MAFSIVNKDASVRTVYFCVIYKITVFQNQKNSGFLFAFKSVFAAPEAYSAGLVIYDLKLHDSYASSASLSALSFAS